MHANRESEVTKVSARRPWVQGPAEGPLLGVEGEKPPEARGFCTFLHYKIHYFEGDKVHFNGEKLIVI